MTKTYVKTVTIYNYQQIKGKSYMIKLRALVLWL